MSKRFLVAWLVIFIAWFLGSFVVHGVLLRSDYMNLTNLFRAEAKPWMAQGVRFGLAVALLTVVPTYMIYFVVQPMPGDVVIKQIVCDGLLTILLGIIVAWLYRSARGGPVSG